MRHLRILGVAAKLLLSLEDALYIMQSFILSKRIRRIKYILPYVRKSVKLREVKGVVNSI